VRVPVFIGHSESINIQTEDEISPEEVKELLADAPGIEVIDDPKKGEYPMALNAAARDDVLVGRIRADESVENGINLWVVADNLRKGAALNAVQIAELLIKEHL
jgi:aspartate-semialdehyde dehydrogenase